MKKLLSGLVLACACTALALPQKGRIMFWYDTEDYASPDAPECARIHAQLLTEFGLRGNFNIVGFYAQRLLETGHTDTIEALKKHCLGSQTLYHSRHPTICEYTDLADWNAAYRECLAQESDCMGRLKAVFGLDRISLFCPPGNSVTPVAMYVYSDAGVKVYGGGIDIFGSRQHDRLAWYCNMLHVPYFWGGAGHAKNPPSNDVLAARNLTVLFTHPCQLYYRGFWDGVNYRGANHCDWRRWTSSPRFTDAEIAENCRGWRELVSRIAADKRLTVIDSDELVAAARPRVAITRKDAPALLAKMEAGLEPVDAPASWCVSDIFQAAVALLGGADSFTPAKAWGFLVKPVGVTAPVTLKKADLVAAAKALDANDFHPAQIAVGGAKVGPADFLIAALKVLATGADEVTVGPRDQVGPIGRHLPNLPTLKLCPKNWCIYAHDFKDQYTSDRLRWQFWTLRYEE